MKLEYGKKLNDLKNAGIIDDATFKSILEKQNENHEDFIKRMQGIDFENEVLIVLKALNIVKKLKKNDESVNNIFKTDTTDFEIELKDGQSFYLEVKSKNYKGSTVKFSEKYMKKYNDISINGNKPVYFLISIHGWWMLFDYQYIREHNNITIKDEKNSKLFEIFGLQSYIFLKGTKIKTVYSKKDNQSLIKSEKYGGMVSQTLYFNGKQIYRCKGINSKEWKNVIVTEALHERLSLNGKSNVKKDNEFYIEELEIDGTENSICIQESEIILSQVFHSGITSSEEIRKENDYNEKHFIPIFFCRNILNEMFKKGMFLIKMHNGILYSMN